ncbi:MAG: hypothetical protein AAGB93_16665 [Planctomycetota bacterium]
MPPANADIEGLLRALGQADVRFVVIGGVSAALQGVPAVTYDLDVVLDPDPENLDRAHAALMALDACFREHLPNKRLVPQRDQLESAGAMLLVTRLGPLDVLGRVATGWRYGDLLERSRALSLADGLELKILDLASLIRIKEAVDRDKDRAVLPLYRRTLEERSEP